MLSTSLEGRVDSLSLAGLFCAQQGRAGSLFLGRAAVPQHLLFPLLLEVLVPFLSLQRHPMLLEGQAGNQTCNPNNPIVS